VMEVGGSPLRDVVLHGGGAQGFDGVGEHAQAVGIQRDEQEIEKEDDGGGGGVRVVRGGCAQAFFD